MAYFESKVWPLIDGHQIELIGEIDEQQKSTFLGNALALLFPISWPEPFGLVMIEAMACGTPVITFPCGSVPEVIDDGITGFVVDPEHALSAIDDIGKLDRRQVRAPFEQRFTARRMAQDYLRLTGHRPGCSLPKLRRPLCSSFSPPPRRRLPF